VIEAIAEARSALSAVRSAGEALSVVGGDGLLDGLVEVQALQAQCDALNASLLARVDLAMLPTSEQNHRSTAAAVAVKAKTNPRTTRLTERRGRWLLDFPIVAEAFAAGLISQAHVEAIRGVDQPRTNLALVEAQDYLVQAAIDLTWDRFQQVLRYWALAADPDGEEPNEQFEKRSLDTHTNADGSVDGRFHLDPLAGHAFTTALERVVQRLWREDQETGSTRTAAQRRADAFMMLIADPGCAGGDAMIHVVMSQTVAEHILASLALTENPQPGPQPPPWPWPRPPHDGGPRDGNPIGHDDIDRRCEFINGIPLHPHWAAAAMAMARFRRLVFSTTGEILEHGRTTRLFPTQAKQALLVRARGRCQFPGCDAPIAWLEADHLVPWNRDGPTDITNGQILCSHHNRLKRDTPPDEDSNQDEDDDEP
jgi:hypothetical protein